MNGSIMSFFLWRSIPSTSDFLYKLHRVTLTRVNKRTFTASILLSKKHRNVKGKVKDLSYLKRETPFVFSVGAKHREHSRLLKETPLVFQAIAPYIDEDDLIDDRSQLLHDLKVRPSAKTETAFIIQPNFKWGKGRYSTRLIDSRLAEAKALVESIQSWDVFDSCIESVHENNPRFFFGSGKISELAEKIREVINENGVTMVFLNTERLSQRQIKELEIIWGCKVFDRYRVVLELFKEQASTKEAKLQVQLAEVQYLRTHLSSSDFEYDQQRGGGKGIMGGGETYMEKARRQLNEAEAKIKKALNLMKQQRNQTKSERLRKGIPQVALVGYTNAGKTTLAKVLSKDNKLHPENRLFATLDSTVHEGKLLNGMKTLFVDTVGFISDLPHELVESFATTLEDVKTADLIIHVADCSHPEYELQKITVENVLEKMNLPKDLQENIIVVLNKADLMTPVQADQIDRDAHHFIVSSTRHHGITDLLTAIEAGVLKSTGRSQYRINIDQEGDELSWLYKNGTVVSATGCEDGSLDIVAILDKANRGRFEKRYHVELKH